MITSGGGGKHPDRIGFWVIDKAMDLGDCNKRLPSAVRILPVLPQTFAGVGKHNVLQQGVTEFLVIEKKPAIKV